MDPRKKYKSTLNPNMVEWDRVGPCWWIGGLPMGGKPALCPPLYDALKRPSLDSEAHQPFYFLEVFSCFILI